MPQVVVGAAIGAAISTGVAVAAGTAFTWAAFGKAFATALVLGGASKALAKKPSFDAGTLPSGQTISGKDPIASASIIYGRTRVGGTIVHMEATESNKYLHLVFAVAAHEIDAFETVYFDDEALSLDANGFGYYNKARIKFKLGADDQTAFSDLVSESTSGWTNNHRLRGRACVYVRLEYDQDKFPNGLPNISFLIRGKKVFDPRTSTTVWSANSALCLNDYLTNTRYGLGCIYANEIDSSALIASANICDEDVTLADTGTENRYETHGAISSANAPQDIINSLLSAMAGKAVFTAGKWRILAGAYYTPTLTFDEDDLRAGFRVQSLVSRRENFNSVKGVFSAKDDNYIVTDFPPVTSSTFVDQDNGEIVYKNIELSLTTSASMAQRLAKIELLKARQQITVTLPLKLQGLQANVGDIVRVNNTRMGWANKPFEVVSMQMSLGETLGVDLELREISTDVFDWATSEEQPFDPAPNTILPNAFLVASPTNLDIVPTTRLAPDGTAQAGLMITWDAPTNAFVNQYEVQWIRGSSNVDWGAITTAATETDNFGLVTASATSAADYGLITEAAAEDEPAYNSLFVTQTYYFIPQAIANIEYAVRVRAINTLGVRSAWVTANQSTQGDTTAPAAPDGVTASGGYRQITLNWTNPAVSDFDLVEIYRNTTNNSASAARIAVTRGSAFVDAPLDINVTRYYWLKAVDRSGNVSGFSSGVNATTQFVDVDSFTEEVMNLFSEAGAYGIEPVASLPATGDFDGQIKYDTTANKLYRWDSGTSAWTDDIFSITAGSVDLASFASGIEPVGIVASLPSPTGYTGAQVVFNTGDNKLYRYTGSAFTSAVATTDLSGTLDGALFSSTFRPVEIVASLPSTGNFAGRTAYLTTDGKLYRYNGTGWTAAVNATDISGTIQAAQIAALEATKITGQLTDAQLQEISTAKLTGQISEAQINNGAISAAKIAAGAVETAKLAVGAVTADTIASNAVTTAKISAGAVTAATIATGAVEAGKIAAGAVTAGTIAAGAVETDSLAANAITTAKLAAGAVTADVLAANSVTAGKIAAAAVSATAIAANAITTDKIQAGAIQTDKIAANAITGGLIAASGVITNSAQINDALITNAKIANLAVTEGKIGDLAVTSAKIANAAITNAKIGDAEISGAKIQNAAITSAKIGDAEVGTLKIAGNAVTVPVSAFTLSSVNAAGPGTWADAQSLTVTTSGQRIFISSSGYAVDGFESGDEGGPVAPVFRIIRDSTVLLESNSASMSYSEQIAAGTYVYKLQISTEIYGAGSLTITPSVSNRSLFAIETKR